MPASLPRATFFPLNLLCREDSHCGGPFEPSRRIAMINFEHKLPLQLPIGMNTLHQSGAIIRLS
jgi:hypothetical protein